MNKNMELWDKVKRPPESALKTIRAGRLSGMTDVSPQWRLQAITEQFGPIGIGWYYTVEDRWTEAGANGELMAFIKIHLYTVTDQGWSAPIVGIGGAALVSVEKTGLHASDEGYKMATTDALSVAMKQLGIAADIYMGLWDGSKYRETAKIPDSSKPVGQVDYEALDEGRKRAMDDIANTVTEAFSFEVQAAYEMWIKHKPSKPNEQSACWWLLDSKCRAAIKKFGAEAQKFTGGALGTE